MRTIHLICNAHIDPVWQWTWDEGISATIATFKSAVNLADDFDYIFCHNESLLYEDIEKKAPDLFEKIKLLVKKGKWVIAGGWYLQPDCMLPSGESIVRQIEVGRKYFSEKFGVTPTVATNYDAFGCSIGLVQILKKCGYKGMLVCRPNGQTQFKYPSRFFDWIAPDGSSIVVSYSSSYNSQLGKAVIKISDYVRGGETGMLGSGEASKNSAKEEVDYVLWGVGNHGGGPSRKDLEDIKNLQIDGVKFLHSSPEKLFEDNIRVGGEVRTSLVPCMPGCYSSMSRLKTLHRKTENLFYATEKMLALAEMAGLKVDLGQLKIAEKKILLSEFHDILPGTVIDDGEQDGTEMLAMASRIIKDYRSDAFLHLAMSDKPAENGEFPVFVFNYLPYEVTTPVEAEFSLADQNWSEEYKYVPRVYLNGEEIECQTIKERSTLNLDWRKRIAFIGKLKPLGLTRFSVRVEKTPVIKRSPAKYDLKKLIEKSVLCGEVGLEMYDDTADPWGMSDAELAELGKSPVKFREMTAKEGAAFCGIDGEISPVHTIEDGEVMTVIERLYTESKTDAVIEYKFYKRENFVDLKVIVEYGDKNKLVRLKIPAPKGLPVGDGPYVVENKPIKREASFHKWCGVKTESDYYAVLNDCVYAGKFEDGFINITLLRGAGYCIHPICDRELYPKDRYLKRIENGRYEYEFRIVRGSLGSIACEAQAFNEKPYALNVFPTGGGGEYPVIRTDKPIVTSVLRKIENGGYEMRFFNPENSGKTFNLTVKDMVKEITIGANEILTVKATDEITVCHDKIL